MQRLLLACALTWASVVHSADPASQPLSPTTAAQALSPAAEATVVPTPAADEADYEFAAIKVRAEKPGLGARYTASEEQLKKQNLANVEDTFKYLPNVFVRKRYIGDANGVLQLRGTGMWQTARTQVLADGYLPLSFHLQTRFNGAPRWNLVSANEVLSTEMDFGPFNPQFGGNAMGGVVNFVTRQPQKTEFFLATDNFFEEYNEYAVHRAFEGNKVNFAYADRWGRFSSFLFVDHQHNLSHPMTYNGITFTAVPGAQKKGTGAYFDRSPQNFERVIYGETGPEEVTQDLYKWKLGFDGGRAFRAQATVAFNEFLRDSTRADSYVYATTGARVWGDKNNNTLDVQVDGKAFNINNADFAVSTQERQNFIAGLGLKGSLDNGLDYETGGSYFRILRDITKSSNENPADPLYNGKGKIQRFEDTGWETAYAKLGDSELWEGRLGLIGGVNFEHYQQASVTHNSNDWRYGDNASFSDLSAGNTYNESVYGQANVGVLESLDLTLGLRQEWWGTYGAVRRSAAKNAPDPERQDQRVSPKATFTWKPLERWEVRLASAKAYRFPILEELYQNRFSATGTTTLANADLRPEDGLYLNFGVTRRLELGAIQVNAYREDVVDSIFFQSDTASGISTYLNVDRVVTNGAEVAFRKDALFGSGIDLGLNSSYNDARIVENARNKALVGNFFQRVPQWRVGGDLTGHFTEKFQATVLGRYASHQYNNLENDDTQNGFGSISEMLVFDLSSRYQVNETLSLSAGVDNLFAYQYYSAHPFPQRSYSVGAKAHF